MQEAITTRQQIASSLQIETPDPWITPIGGALAIAADGIWSGRTWLHGAVGWRTEHLGWRGAYAGTALGWYDRARTHFQTYAANQVSDTPPNFDHPRQDSVLHLARAEKRWGTPMYSDGYICRRPGRREMSHYDMNLVYVDALLRYLRATGDEPLMRQLFPTLQGHFAWEKRNFDPDGDHLYDAYCCIWASDALYYNGGAVTHASAYNCFANREMARIAERIGEDPTPYHTEAEAIEQAMQNKLWHQEGEHWAEFRDRDGHRRLHTSAALWTIYHAIDSEVGSPEQARSSARYVRRSLLHPMVCSPEMEESYHLPSTTDWQPYIWSINNVAIAEVMHMALAYWQVGMNEEAFHLMKGVAMDNMYLGTSPLNFGQLSYLDAARGECYRDFADPIGVWARALIEGLYGIRPDLLAGKVTLQPGFPQAWEHASIRHHDIDYRFQRTGLTDHYTIDHRYGAQTTLYLVVEGQAVKEVRVNGKKSRYMTERSHPYGLIRIPLQKATHYRVSITYRIRRERIIEPITAPQTVAQTPIDYTQAKMRPIDLAAHYNASVSDIYRNEYLAPRPSVTTLQIPKQGYGDWCHPHATTTIDDRGLRDTLRRHTINERMGLIERGDIPFLLAHTGPNIAFTSLWDNYPDRISLPLSGRGRCLLLLMAGSTNHMQSHIANGVIEVHYTDGSTHRTELINPDNWASIEQLGIANGGAFRAPDLLRLSLRDALLSRTLDRDLGLEGINRFPSDGAAVVVEVPLSADKTLQTVSLETLSGDVVIGIMGITLVE